MESFVHDSPSPNQEHAILNPAPREQEKYAERSLRPRHLGDFVGQTALKDRLAVFLQAAVQRKEALDHVLFYGPPGLGKTSLSHVLAGELQVGFTSTSGPALERVGDLAAILTNLQPRSILFIDEIHRLHRTIEEALYPALEDYALDIMIGEGPSARIMKLSLPPFTLVGATTRAGLLTSPLMGRFGMTFRLDYYEPSELAQILLRSAQLLGCAIDRDAAELLSRRSRGTPRIANRLLRRARDFAQVRGNGNITTDFALQTVTLLDIDNQGLDPLDRRFLSIMVEKFEGGPVGIDNLAAALSEDRETLEDIVEPYLIQQGFLQRTPRGRTATAAAYTHLGQARPQRVMLSQKGFLEQR